MKLLHVSDNHSYFPQLPEDGDVVIHTGDFLPNASRGNLSIEIPFQTQWIKSRIETFRSWLDGKHFIFSAGNHDFCTEFCNILNEAGINAVDITNKLYRYKNITMYGFPWVPYIAGEWSYECQIDEMARHIRKLKDILIENKVDILLAHSPIANILDEYQGLHLGNTLMANLFSYELEEKYWPKLYCCGHIHQAAGVSKLVNMIISNAATRVHTIDMTIEKG